MAIFQFPASSVSISGGATEAKQDTQITLLQDIENNTDGLETSLSSVDAKTPSLVGGRVPVDGSGVTQPVSGTISVSGSVAVTGPLTDAQLRATAVPVAPNITRAAGVSDANTQRVVIASDSPVAAGLGAQADAAASSDTGTFSVIAFIKRGLENWTTLLARIPALVSGRIPVDGSGVTQPVSAVSLPLPTGAATQTTLASVLDNVSLEPVDQIDSTPLLNVSLTNIPASASSPVQVVASTASLVRKVVSVEDIGEFIGLFTGPASSEVLLCVLPLGGGEIEVQIPASTRLSLRHMKNTTITSGFISLNLLG